MPDPSNRTPDLREWLKRHGPDDTMQLSHSQVRWLHDELQRLRQSADRLKRQNRKVRLKIERVRAEFGADGVDAAPEGRTEFVERFAEAVEGYCAWCKSEHGTAEEAVSDALSWMAKLFGLALRLGYPVDFDDAIEAEVTHEEWKSVYAGIQGIPFQHYLEIFDPLNEEAEEPVTGDISDDLADVYRDLESGRRMWEAGNSREAHWQWRHSFETHWSSHAASALKVLTRWSDGRWVKDIKLPSEEAD